MFPYKVEDKIVLIEVIKIINFLEKNMENINQVVKVTDFKVEVIKNFGLCFAVEVQENDVNN